MAITTLDILNLSHALKDVCEVNCNTSECLSQTLKVMLQSNLLTANMIYSRQLERECCGMSERKQFGDREAEMKSTLVNNVFRHEKKDNCFEKPE